MPAVFGLAFPHYLSSNPDTIYLITLVASFTLGFFVMSAGPVGFQYAAEVSYPAPESASQGILLWVGQLTGMVFVAGMIIGAWIVHRLHVALGAATSSGAAVVQTEPARHRSVLVQAPTSYTMTEHRQQQRFLPLPDRSHGAWED